MCETLGKAEVWLIRTFWDLEIPHPTPPNFIYVGGLHCKPANQLPEVFHYLTRTQTLMMMMVVMMVI